MKFYGISAKQLVRTLPGLIIVFIAAALVALCVSSV